MLVVTQKLDDANGTQIILGVNAKADPFFLGVEYRQISVKPKATIGIRIPSENIGLKTTNEVDLSHTWTGIRLG
jgi:hypothetical protein